MDVFVQNLFEDIEIPEDVPDVEHLLTAPSSCPSRHASQVDNGYETILTQTSRAAGPTLETIPPVSQLLPRKSFITAGLSFSPQSRGSVQHKRPISGINIPFVAPVPCEPACRKHDRPHKKHCEEDNSRNVTPLNNVEIQDEDEQPEEQKTIAEQYPLKGPAGINVFNVLSNVMMDGTPNVDDGLYKKGNSWVMAMTMLDNNDLGYEFGKCPDFPDHFSVSEYVTLKFNIKRIIKEAYMHKFGFRIQWLVVFIVTQKLMGVHVMSVLMDRSGQMLGYMSEELHTRLKHVVSGCTCILKNVFVYNPVGYMPYLVIRGGNVVKVVRNNS